MRIGFAGLVHGHVWGLIDHFAATGAEMAAVADPTPLMETARKNFQREYKDWRQMLDAEALDALVVTTDSLEGANVAVEALGRGIPVFVEKPMAANAPDAQRMLEAWENAGVPLLINWPFVWNSWTHDLKKRIDGGEVGHVFHLRYRNGHHGPKEIGCDEYFVGWLYDEKRNGGGAIADFCGYGAVLCRWYFGVPDAVYAVRDNYTKDYDVPDDHAIIVLKYPKRTAILEGTWATFGFDQSANPVVHGKTGTLGVYENEIRLFRAGQEPQVLEGGHLPGPGPASYFLQCIERQSEPEGMMNPRIAADACRIIDAAKRSARSGREESV